MAKKNEPTTATAQPDFVITRVFAAPRELLWAAWADPRQLAKWWGPRGLNTEVTKLDVRPGGAYRLVMRSAEGVEYPMQGIYREVVKPERLVYTCDLSEHPDEWHDLIDRSWRTTGRKPAIDLITEVTFAEHAGKTTQTVRMFFPSAALRDSMLKMGMNEGWSSSFERLTEELANISSG
jgi:uncharacterized protein YndB with AHSA1/START domain